MDMKRFEGVTIEELEAAIQAKREELEAAEKAKAEEKERVLTAAREALVQAAVDYLIIGEFLSEEDLKDVDWTALMDMVKEAEQELADYIQVLSKIKNTPDLLPAFSIKTVKKPRVEVKERAATPSDHEKLLEWVHSWL